MSRQIRISIEDDEVFERLKRRKDALDLSWEDVLRRGLRDSSEPPRGPNRPTPPNRTDRANRSRDSEEGRDDHGSRRGPRHPHGGYRGRSHAHGSHRSRGRRHGREHTRDEVHAHHAHSPFAPEFGERLAENIRSSLESALGGGATVGSSGESPLFGAMGSIDDEIDRLEEAEDAVLVLGEDRAASVPLRVELHIGADGMDVDVVAVRTGKDTGEMNRFGDGARAVVAKRLARGDTARLELADGDETYDVRPDLTWARGPDGVPVVADAAIRSVVFDESED
ncbi:hypothetical protein ACFPYI_12655 [Halomarina salina]|uniref:Uncharacterized protein n=1 Tax=Halomarina salina TaxID=1872699 RepID=A0ABD5RNV5_9EURY|nr:hypothetical protein [Halomarina salina]